MFIQSNEMAAAGDSSSFSWSDSDGKGETPRTATLKQVVEKLKTSIHVAVTLNKEMIYTV